MDTISRENNSYLPVAGVIVGVLALVLSGVALAKISSAKKEISAQVEPLSLKIDEAEGQARNAAASADKASGNINKLATDTQSAFQQVAQELGNIRGEITKVQEAKVTKAAPGKAAAGPVVAGADEYIIKSGDTFAKIARAQGATLADVQAVNPGVDAGKLKVGQKIKLPAKK
ncbi:LysM peptidoglycan-binding domain-containing protein [Rariglobus hedericola]|uniref:LysM peptidoglycan-binding domain-containing protein n=1 Tax=Rariglobus hedericola TaxID=2597822 RepID=A0A556QRW4_9BACT|nr:LysM domain-containing protein [Rariglobus hedericola]TSJ79386.1 LysM peptidoglycan-binding domain-containing protein [Rariglobus hedericola]